MTVGNMDMHYTRTRNTAALLALLAVIAGCGGGGGGGSTGPTVQPGGIQGTGRARGAISGFGSIFVNGVEYSTSGATITSNGRSAIESELKVGYVVEVQGRVDSNGTTGTATAVSFDDDVRGPVQAVDVANSRLTVLGQTVLVDGATSFDGYANLAAIAVGDAVVISGFRDANGDVRATRVEKTAAPSEFEITGALASLDTNAKTFLLGTQLVDYSAAGTLTNFANPANGQLVEVRGTLSGTTLRATRVEGKNRGVQFANGDHGEIEGLITRFQSNTDFDVDGTKVTTNASTQFPNGTALALGAKVEVEGSADANGTLVASKVSLRDAGEARVTGTVTAVDAAGNRVSVFGIQASTSSATRFEDKSRANQRPFNLTRVAVGDYVELRGAEGAPGVVASLLQRDDAASAIELRGVARNVDAAQLRFTLIGVTVRLANGAQCRDADEQSVPCATLLGALTASSQVTARDSAGTASLPGSELVADRVELNN